MIGIAVFPEDGETSNLLLTKVEGYWHESEMPVPKIPIEMPS